MNSTKKAFSIIEFLITFAIFSFGLIPMYMVFQSSHRTTAKAKNILIAQTIGRITIDELRALGINGIYKRLNNTLVGADGVSYPIAHTQRAVKGLVVPQDANSITYPKYWQKFTTTVVIDKIDREDKQPPPKYYLITVYVRWQEETKQVHELRFATLVGNIKT